ncbi:MAG: ABC transporter permease [Methanobacteriota archaeon]|nr:MAG: ABC transporter permease [Euryarchaeota archaeon]
MVIAADLKRIAKVLTDTSRSNRRFLFGFYGLMTFVVVGFVLSPLSPYDPRRWNMVPRDKPPSLEYPLGTTSTGQNMFWLLFLSIRNSLVIGLVAGAAVTVFGVVIGLIAGFKGGLFDRVVMLIADIMIVIPGMPIIILLVFLFHKHLSLLFLSGVIALFGWARPLRQVRAQMLSLREREFIYTARFSGKNIFGIVFGEILPHILPWTLAMLANFVLISIGMEAGLAVIGLSLSNEATLGMMIYWALQYNAIFRNIWWWFLPSILAICFLFFTLFSLYTGITNLITREA